ncbi:hypothetical protein ES319_A05G093300v1 [Gossypium barbadense]|uniref:non-specific serine/threonine protein kinase n=2 Tax=Gossypium TaxID=3633 RepID=A0A2P5X089_GOSBA|nr:hypothetical protein ES319_A05G093300v1 [Gossypium barbadense]PPR96715.1 hypothetical protein GOBAR_AA23965 [Gossypium barbadense]
MKFESSNCSFSSVATIFWCASLLLVGWFPTLVTGIRIKGHESDEEALLAIKSQINHDPFGVTKSWNRSVAMCRWHGITCAPRHQRVTKLNLSQKGLRGSLSPYVGNLSFLRFIILQDNNFHGVIPPEIGRLPRLETLSLYNNSFGGRIPPNLTHCSNLILFRASSNKLIGNIPVELGKLVKLENLEIAHNNLTGHLPTSLGNVSTLQDINLEGNYLEGGLQVTLGFLKRLAVLKLDTNNFSGFFPPSIFNLSSLRLLSLVDNQLSGSLPFSLGYSLPNLSGIYIGGNYFSGTLPVSLSNASKLQGFDISYNHFSGSVSISFGNAHNLTWLNMESNDLGGGTTDLDFITTMTNCSKLEVISLAANKFSGLLPNSIANLSISLQQLSLGENHITGSIPLGIANLVNLIGIGLAENRLTGTIPDSLGMLKKLQTLYLGGNTLTGTIPASVGNLSVLTRMTLEENLLEGSIPAEFGRCQILIMMALGSNKLTGSVPKEIFSIPTLSIALDLSDNLLIGSIPSDIGNLVNLVYLNISNNNFSGHIPAALSGCTTLETLSLGENHFDGSIPDSLSSLRSIAELDLSSNNLSGQIPDYLEKLSFLKYLNLSHNRFEGPVPTKGVFNNASAVSLTRNGRLCGGIAELHLPSCPFTHPKDPKKSVPLKLIWIVCGVLGILMLSSLLFCWLRKRGVKAKPSLAFRLGNSIMMVSFHQLLKATDGFAPANLLGQGSFGNVYKGNLYQNQEQNVIAVKVMNLQVQGASRSFLTECKTLRNVRHRNLVKIISACSSIDFQGNPFKALIYEFIPNGSLHQWLHDTIQHGEPKILNFLQRLNIAIDVALALDYLHHHCEVPVVHCDLKPSNILLDHDMVARVGDFGLARFFPKSMNSLSGNSSSTHCLKGTIGYAPPEYGIGTEATTSGDMYSFGILLLEIFTRKRPTDDMFKDGLTLHLFSKMALLDQVLEAVDPLLLPGDNERQSASSSRNQRRANMEETKMKECFISILKVGIACSVESPTDRMDIVDAAKELHFIRDKFVGTRIRTERERANHL